MDTETNEQLDIIKKKADTLLVLHHKTGTVGIVQRLGDDGELHSVHPRELNNAEIVSFDSNENSFAEFYAGFYYQLKEPGKFSFFKVKEYEAGQTALHLQRYIDDSSDEGRSELKEYEISIDSVEAYRRAGGEMKGKREDPDNNYLYKLKQVNWKMMEKLGLSKEILQELGVLESMLKGYKADKLVPVQIDLVTIKGIIEAGLSLRTNDSGEVELMLHPVRTMPDFSIPFFGHLFSEEDKRNLMGNGNMGRVVDLVHRITGELVPSLISRDRLTNELIQVRAEFVRIPLVIKGVTLDEQQRKILREGKPLFLENMLSARGSLFNAAV